MNLHASKYVKAKCHFCAKCTGKGCIAEMPGMGGIRDNINFQLNCADWDLYPMPAISDEELYKTKLPALRLAPMTGGVENVGYKDEKQFYFDLIFACANAGLPLAIGDGTPDEKLQSGIDAVRTFREQTGCNVKTAVFIKPYNNERIIERARWTNGVAEIIGIDIDAYNIITMRNKVSLEKKTPAALIELMDFVHNELKLPFAIKGVFTKENLDIVSKVEPDIVVISNHGGRVDNRTGSTIDFLAEHNEQLQKSAPNIWIDGGIRKMRDLHVASFYGAKEVMIGRPLVSALCKNRQKGVEEYLQRTFNFFAK